MRNSHLTCIAPTGTISLAFADNASNGIEPAYAWRYRRNKRMPDGQIREYGIEDHAYRLYCQQAGAAATLLPAFVTAHELAARDHLRMVAAVQPYIDAAISKTVNIPTQYPFAEFESLYLEAWQAGLKGITVFRPRARGEGGVVPLSQNKACMTFLLRSRLAAGLRAMCGGKIVLWVGGVVAAVRNWDIFCTVVDNFGDIGVCWRLARQLVHEHGVQVRLWVDDLASFSRIQPQVDPAREAQFCQGVEACAYAKAM